MQLTELLNVMETVEVVGPTGLAISELCCDSRQVATGAMFFALPGTSVDGAKFVPEALEKGAAVIVTENRPAEMPRGRTLLLVENVRHAMAVAANRFYGRPSEGIPVIGVTGTNGKTTVTYLLEAILQQAGFSPAVFGTVDYRLGEKQFSSSHTTPESIELMRMMAEFRGQGADALILEVSSHALEQHRADGVAFDVAIFTNLTPEHLDYHGNLASYFSSKRRLFSELLGEGCAVLNSDDEFGRQLLAEFPNACSFGAADADVCSVQLEQSREGIKGFLKTPLGEVAVDSSLIGAFNVSNLLAAVAAAVSLKVPPQQIAAGIAAAPQVPGRVERVTNSLGILALVDYAHTGDALEQVLKTLTQLDANKLITVAGCGGDRDPLKRPVMAAAAVNYSTLAVLTSDNPRTEDPLAILEQMRQGALAADAKEYSAAEASAAVGKSFVVIPDRREAIRFAVRRAVAGDLLLVAGKGHEDYQILGREKVHFDDREELQQAMTEAATERAGEVAG